MEEEILKAVIPAAGRGTRLLPLTRSVPKELLPVGRLPMIHWCVGEAADAGSREVVIVIRKGKESIRSYFEDEPAEEADGSRLPGGLERIPPETEIRFACQEFPRGPGDALLSAAGEIGDHPFILMYPDDVFPAGGGRLKKMVDLYRRTGEMVTGLIRVEEARGHLFGNCGHVDLEKDAGGVYRIRRLLDKEPGQFRARTKSEVRWTGRHVLEPAFLGHIEKFDTGQKDRELDDVAAFQDLIEQRGMLGLLLEDEVYDVGNMPGYLAANARLASDGIGRVVEETV